MENEIVKYPYEVMLNKQVGEYTLVHNELNKLNNHFFNKLLTEAVIQIDDLKEIKPIFRTSR